MKIRTHQHQHVWNGDDIGLVPHRHGRFKVVASVFLVRHRVVGMKCDVVFLDAFSERFKGEKILDFKQFVYLYFNNLADWLR